MLMLSWQAYTEISPQLYTGVLMSACPVLSVALGLGRVDLDLYVDGIVFLTTLLT